MNVLLGAQWISVFTMLNLKWTAQGRLLSDNYILSGIFICFTWSSIYCVVNTSACFIRHLRSLPQQQKEFSLLWKLTLSLDFHCIFQVCKIVPPSNFNKLSIVSRLQILLTTEHAIKSFVNFKCLIHLKDNYKKASRYTTTTTQTSRQNEAKQKKSKMVWIKQKCHDISLL